MRTRSQVAPIKAQKLSDASGMSPMDIPKEDPTVQFLYSPHNISLLLLTIGLLVYLAFTLENDPVNNIKVAVGSMSLVVIVFGMMQFRDGPFIRPHPVFWRAVLALGLIYQLLLVFVVFQSKDSTRELLRVYVDSSLGVPLPEKNYAEDCSLTWAVLYEQCDVFVLLHAFGWFFKSLIIREFWLCWVLSILFEVMEYSLEHQLPNFAECWWDHWILDVLTTNALGIYCGMLTCKFFEIKTYSWRRMADIPDVPGKLQRTVQQFTPHSWTSFHWDITERFYSFLCVLFLIYLYLLWIPVTNMLNLYRLLFFFLACLPAVRELYQYLTDPTCKRLGAHCWLTTANILTEVLIVIKFGAGEFDQPTPRHVIILWTILIGSLTTWAAWNFGFRKGFSRHE